MPTSPAKNCARPGCPGLARDGAYCPEHSYEREDQRTSAQLGYDYRWQRIRRAMLRREPLCRECKRQGKTTAATEVHHIVPLSKGGGNEASNLMPICHKCHAKITNRRGGAG